jgi:SAM-dependent methyltransferase
MGRSLRQAAGVTSPDASAVYPLGSSPGESARLQRQAEELAADSAALLDRVGLRPGQAAIDLGCGPRGILDMLAERVFPAGRVVGLDADPAHTALAAEFAAARGLSCVEIITADARSTRLPAGAFDVVHARTLLINLAEPATAAAEMTRLARPGGWVASAEPDTEHALCYPPHPAFDRLRTSSRWPSAATAPIRGSAAAYPSSSARPDWKMSGSRPGCRRSGPSAWTWYAACSRR